MSVLPQLERHLLEAARRLEVARVEAVAALPGAPLKERVHRSQRVQPAQWASDKPARERHAA